jgi:hypothetical protein
VPVTISGTMAQKIKMQNAKDLRKRTIQASNHKTAESRAFSVLDAEFGRK